MSSQDLCLCTCSHCGGQLGFHPESAGTQAVCPHCRKKTTLERSQHLVSGPRSPQNGARRRLFTLVAFWLFLVGGLVAVGFIAKLHCFDGVGLEELARTPLGLASSAFLGVLALTWAFLPFIVLLQLGSLKWRLNRQRELLEEIRDKTES